MVKGNRKVIESLYDCIANVYEYRTIRDEKTKRIVSKEILVLENIKCRLSYKNVDIKSTDSFNALTEKIKLFLPSDITINSGSKIVVNKNGISSEYINSSPSKMYTNHQEIDISIFKGWA